MELLPLPTQAKVSKKAEAFAPCGGHHPTEYGAKNILWFPVCYPLPIMPVVLLLMVFLGNYCIAVLL